MEKREYIENVARSLDDEGSFTFVMTSVNGEVENEELKEHLKSPQIDVWVPWIFRLN